MALQTQIEYARHRKERDLDGTTHTAVQKALSSGRISYADQVAKLIDPAVADVAWAKNTEPRPNYDSGKTKGKTKGEQQPRGAGKATVTRAEAAAEDEPGPEDTDYKVSRGRREFYESELARLKVERERGKLILADTVRKVLYEAGRIIRAGHEDIVAQLAPDLASETVIAKVERILKARLDRLDNEFADRIEKIDETFREQEEE